MDQTQDQTQAAAFILFQGLIPRGLPRGGSLHPTLSDLQEVAQVEGVKFVACKMTVDMMQFSEKDFIDGATIQTAEEFMKYAKDCRILLYTQSLLMPSNTNAGSMHNSIYIKLS